MQGKSMYKVPNGKLLKINLDFDADKINSIEIHGDFFLYPEEGRDMLEQAIAGSAFNELKAKIDSTIAENNLQPFGFDSESLVTAINMAKDSARGGESK